MRHQAEIYLQSEPVAITMTASMTRDRTPDRISSNTSSCSTTGFEPARKLPNQQTAKTSKCGPAQKNRADEGELLSENQIAATPKEAAAAPQRSAP